MLKSWFNFTRIFWFKYDNDKSKGTPLSHKITVYSVNHSKNHSDSDTQAWGEKAQSASVIEARLWFLKSSHLQLTQENRRRQKYWLKRRFSINFFFLHAWGESERLIYVWTGGGWPFGYQIFSLRNEFSFVKQYNYRNISLNTIASGLNEPQDYKIQNSNVRLVLD